MARQGIRMGLLILPIFCRLRFQCFPFGFGCRRPEMGAGLLRGRGRTPSISLKHPGRCNVTKSRKSRPILPSLQRQEPHPPPSPTSSPTPPSREVHYRYCAQRSRRQVAMSLRAVDPRRACVCVSVCRYIRACYCVDRDGRGRPRLLVLARQV
jgi:hypothetical protein